MEKVKLRAIIPGQVYKLQIMDIKQISLWKTPKKRPIYILEWFPMGREGDQGKE